MGTILDIRAAARANLAKYFSAQIDKMIFDQLSGNVPQYRDGPFMITITRNPENKNDDSK